MMKRMAHIVLAVAFVGILAGQTFSITASAHGGHGNGHHGSSAPVYYCNGHEAHEHNNGVCPYADSDYYYCDGHEAHHHDNGVCPYADSDYYYCDGHDAHHHDNGVCPYADSDYYYCDGHEAHHHNNGICPYADSDTVQSTSDKSDNSESSSSESQKNSTSTRIPHRRRVMQNLSDALCMY